MSTETKARLIIETKLFKDAVYTDTGNPYVAPDYDSGRHAALLDKVAAALANVDGFAVTRCELRPRTGLAFLTLELSTSQHAVGEVDCGCGWHPSCVK